MKTKKKYTLNDNCRNCGHPVDGNICVACGTVVAVKVTETTDIRNQCWYHASEQAVTYCRNCNKLICNDCTFKCGDLLVCISCWSRMCHEHFGELTTGRCRECGANYCNRCSGWGNLLCGTCYIKEVKEAEEERERQDIIRAKEAERKDIIRAKVAERINCGYLTVLVIALPLLIIFAVITVCTENLMSTPPPIHHTVVTPPQNNHRKKSGWQRTVIMSPPPALLTTSPNSSDEPVKCPCAGWTERCYKCRQSIEQIKPVEISVASTGPTVKDGSVGPQQYTAWRQHQSEKENSTTSHWQDRKRFWKNKLSSTQFFPPLKGSSVCVRNIFGGSSAGQLIEINDNYIKISIKKGVTVKVERYKMSNKHRVRFFRKDYINTIVTMNLEKEKETYKRRL